MAKKKEEKRSFGQMPLPNGRKRFKTVRKVWNGLNEIHTSDSGCLSECMNISTRYYPDLCTESFQNLNFWNKLAKLRDEDVRVMSMNAFGKFLIII